MKADIIRAIARTINRPDRGLGPGSKERKQTLIDICERFALDADVTLNKPLLARVVAERAGLGGRWTADCWSSGQTITTMGLEVIHEAASRLRSRERPSRQLPRARPVRRRPRQAAREKSRSKFFRRTWMRVMTAEDIGPPAKLRHGALVVQIDLDVRHERTAGHQRILRAVARAYESQGYELAIGNFDLLATRGRSAVLVEAKTITPTTERMQVRAAIGQLLVYPVDDAALRTLLRGKRVRRVLATNRRLSSASRAVLNRFHIVSSVVT